MCLVSVGSIARLAKDAAVKLTEANVMGICL